MASVSMEHHLMEFLTKEVTMATTTLTNGTKIPARASRDWYSDLSTNWYLLDNHLGDTDSHLDNGLAPKATADADGNVIADTYATKTELSTLSDTVGTKANDSSVVHKADAETITGAKTFSDTLTSADVVPSATDTYSLGSASYKYQSVWFNYLQDIPTNTVEWHNSHYRGINLISDGHFADMASLLIAIRAEDWSDIYIGDYVELTFTYEGASRTVKFYVGEIDKFYNVGSLTTHHLVMITGDLGVNQAMNDTNTTEGGYVGSVAHTTTLPALYEIINPLFNNAILTHRERLSRTVKSTQSVSLTLDGTTYTCSDFPIFSSGQPSDTGVVTLEGWHNCNLVLMSEVEMYGSNRFSSSGFDDTMTPEGQLAVFKYNKNLITIPGMNTWLRNVNSASRFCICYDLGFTGCFSASSAALRLRPRFLIG